MINLFQFNLLLAIGWCALVGAFTPASLAAGFVAGFVALSVVAPLFEETGYFARALGVTQLAVYFFWELSVSSAQVAWDVLTPIHRSRPAIVAVPLDLKHPMQITLLANLISLTPGSLSLDVSPDQKTLYVHAMFVEDPDEFRANVKEGFERRVREATE